MFRTICLACKEHVSHFLEQCLNCGYSFKKLPQKTKVIVNGLLWNGVPFHRPIEVFAGNELVGSLKTGESLSLEVNEDCLLTLQYGYKKNQYHIHSGKDVTLQPVLDMLWGNLEVFEL
jgi:hypothetical protein